jgi:hypothetical protein
LNGRNEQKMFRTILATLFLSTLGFVASGAAQAQQLPQNAAYSLCQLDPAHPTGIRCVAFGGGSCVASPAGFPDDWRCSPPGHPGFAERLAIEQALATRGYLRQTPGGWC